MNTLPSVTSGAMSLEAFEANPPNIICNAFNVSSVSQDTEAMIGKMMLDYERKNGHKPLAPRSKSDNRSLLDAKSSAVRLRVKLIDLMQEHGPMTAVAMGRMIGENAKAVGSNLHCLRQDDFVEQGDGKRDRPWNLTEKGMDFDTSSLKQPEFEPEQRSSTELEPLVIELLRKKPMATCDIAAKLEARVPPISAVIKRLYRKKLIDREEQRARQPPVWFVVEW